MTHCYRDRNNGVYYRKDDHRHDCNEVDCKGCTTCHDDHCTAKKNCAWHLSEGELTCGRCIASARRDLGWIIALAPLLPVAATSDGIESEAANLAGPATDPRGWTERKIAQKGHLDHWLASERITEDQWLAAVEAMPEDDDRHPYAVLCRWQMMLAEDWGHDLPARLTTAAAASYLDRNLHRVANDPEQDFPLLASDLRHCRSHVESVLRNDRRPKRGAPCRSCKAPAPRLALRPGHYCDDEDCERLHYTDSSGDRWVCPANPDHWWSDADYRRWVYADAQAERMGA